MPDTDSTTPTSGDDFETVYQTLVEVDGPVAEIAGRALARIRTRLAEVEAEKAVTYDGKSAMEWSIEYDSLRTRLAEADSDERENLRLVWERADATIRDLYRQLYDARQRIAELEAALRAQQPKGKSKWQGSRAAVNSITSDTK